ncbi:MAG TPA: energy transducer TonB [Gemmatimonadales bacterium]|nr:energy transducer TonB [Gemmatimonadales bacterium]
MTGRLLVALSLAALACGRKDDDGSFRLSTSTPIAPAYSDADQPPVAINSASPVDYPVPLLEQGIEGRVLLRMYADTHGTLIPDSIRVAESSGYPALDSAALSGARGLRYSPALRHGRAVAGAFLQPIHFRRPRSQTAP